MVLICKVHKARRLIDWSRGDVRAASRSSSGAGDGPPAGAMSVEDWDPLARGPCTDWPMGGSFNHDV